MEPTFVQYLTTISSPFILALYLFLSLSLLLSLIFASSSRNFLSFPLFNTNYTDLSQVPACLPLSQTVQSDFTLALYPRRISCFQRLRDSEGEGRLIGGGGSGVWRSRHGDAPSLSTSSTTPCSSLFQPSLYLVFPLFGETSP